MSAIYSSEDGIDQMEFLIRGMEGFMMKKEVHEKFTIPQIVILTRTFSFAGHSNFQKFFILDKFLPILENRITELQETDVLKLLASYAYIRND